MAINTGTESITGLNLHASPDSESQLLRAVSSSGWQNNATIAESQFPMVGAPDNQAACEYFNPYKPEGWRQYLELLVETGFNSVRVDFSWQDIFTTEREKNWEVIAGYKRLLELADEHGVEVTATILHFTIPKWLADQGGVKTHRFNNQFAAYVNLVAEQFGPYINTWFPINEINVLLNTEMGAWPPSNTTSNPLLIPGKLLNARKAKMRLVQAHNDAYHIVHRVYERNGWETPRVGPVVNFSCYVPFGNKDENRLIATIFEEFNFHNPDQMIAAGTADFIAINYYFTRIVDILYSLRHAAPNMMPYFGEQLKALLNGNYLATERSDLDWSLSVDGFGLAMEKMVNRYYPYFEGNIPVMITEVGLATADEDLKRRYIHSFMQKLFQIPGVDVEMVSLWTALRDQVHEWNIPDEYPPFGQIYKNGAGLEMSAAGKTLAEFDPDASDRLATEDTVEAFANLKIDHPHSEFRTDDLKTKLMWRPFARFLMQMLAES